MVVVCQQLLHRGGGADLLPLPCLGHGPSLITRLWISSLAFWRWLRRLVARLERLHDACDSLVVGGRNVELLAVLGDLPIEEVYLGRPLVFHVNRHRWLVAASL